MFLIGKIHLQVGTPFSPARYRIVGGAPQTSSKAAGRDDGTALKANATEGDRWAQAPDVTSPPREIAGQKSTDISRVYQPSLSPEKNPRKF